MLHKRFLNPFTTILLALFFALFGFWLAPYLSPHFFKKEMQKNQKEDFKQASLLLSESKPKEALSIISQYLPEIEQKTPEGKKWTALLVKATLDIHDAPQMTLIYKHDPTALESNEKASLLAAEGLLMEKNHTDFLLLRKNWKEKATQPDAWILLDAQYLLASNQTLQASTLLNAKVFESPLEVKRLLLLAFLTAGESPKQAWDLLDLAKEKDPKNSEIYSYRGKLLEAAEKPNLAVQEYLAALNLSPDNFFLKDQLAEFYIRQGKYSFALEIWETLLNTPQAELIWIKAWFWNRVALPLKTFQNFKTPPKKGILTPFIHYLNSLKPDQFWDPEAFAKIPENRIYLNTLQSTYWLKLISLIQKENHKEALQLLNNNPFQEFSWNKPLEKALKTLLSYKENPTLSIAAPSELSLETFFKTLQDVSLKEKDTSSSLAFDSLLKSKEAAPLAFLAAGWTQAALQIKTNAPLSSKLPGFVFVSFTKAIEEIKGEKEALVFAKKQPTSKELQLLIGELNFSINAKEAALAEFLPLAKLESPLGFKAAQLATLLFIDQKEYKKALETLEGQPLLKNSLTGKELSARIAFLQGDLKEATSIYQSLVDQSLEAKSFIARQAFENKNWKLAEDLTLALLQEYPNNPLLLENLKKIYEQQTGE